jgi:succinate dehydrogenase / fumarate reductase, iron-sulfur subunit
MQTQEFAYILSTCMTCGCCLEACPQVNDHSLFMGPAAMGQATLFTLHPTAALNKDERLEAVMGVGGVTDCGNAQNCERVCSKGIPLTGAIAELATKRRSSSSKTCCGGESPRECAGSWGVR